MEKELEKYGELKIIYEQEGDGYFFYGYGLPSEFDGDAETSILFEQAAEAVERFKAHIENQIKKNGGEPEDWVA